MSFKIGDIVICKQEYLDRLTVNNAYVVIFIEEDETSWNKSKGPWIRVKDDKGEVDGWKKSFFELLENPTKLERLIYGI